MQYGNVGEKDETMRRKFCILRSIFAAFAMMAYAALGAATPTVTDLAARQRYPWNGLVDISFALSESGYIAVTATFASAADDLHGKMRLCDSRKAAVSAWCGPRWQRMRAQKPKNGHGKPSSE